jgi:disulfide bond formation protein DsbB
VSVAAGEIRFDAQGRETAAPRSRGSSARRLDAWFLLVFLACVAALAAALVSQHRFGMDPCPWCTLQRAIFAVIGLAALLGLAWRGPVGRRVSAVLVLLLALCGVAASLWQHFQAAASASCNLTFADRLMNATRLPTLLPEVFEARATCADAAASLLGISYDFWSLALFALIAVAAIVMLRTARRRA